ncbi:hypothetical protein E4T56_gene19642 [Termitomyces sp. T112]|nr:hypothetical protein E4T56_gene19642 [Termitomyces sp. T112]
MFPVVLCTTFLAVFLATALPVQEIFDLQGHRGGRGETIENSLHSFSWGLIDGVNTLELDNGITKDGVVVVSHDQFIAPEKCEDTAPAFANDPDFPYVGKFIVNLTLAQIKTLDCGSERLIDFPLQLKYPLNRIPTLQEVFDFVGCADPQRKMQFNVESKIDPTAPSQSRGVDDFVQLQHAVFKNSGYDLKSITYQSFDWRTLVGMKALEPSIPAAALVSSSTAGDINGTTPWLAGLKLSDFPGDTVDVTIAEAAKSIKADILSPASDSDVSPVQDPTQDGYVPFTTQAMVDRSHELGMRVIPWTVDRWNVADQLLDFGVDGIITDFPAQLRRLLQQRGRGLAPTFDQEKVFKCLAKFV